jgi:hypothetical protein
MAKIGTLPGRGACVTGYVRSPSQLFLPFLDRRQTREKAFGVVQRASPDIFSVVHKLWSGTTAVFAPSRERRISLENSWIISFYDPAWELESFTRSRGMTLPTI